MQDIQIILSKEPDYETMTKSSSRPCCVRDYYVYRKATWGIAGLQLEPIYLREYDAVVMKKVAPS